VADEETGEYLAELELDFGEYELIPKDEEALNSFMAGKGLKTRVEKLETKIL